MITTYTVEILTTLLNSLVKVFMIVKELDDDRNVNQLVASSSSPTQRR